MFITTIVCCHVLCVMVNLGFKYKVRCPMCRDQVIPTVLDENQINAHLQEMGRMLQRHELQNRFRQQETERRERLNRLADAPMDDEDRRRIIEVYSSDVKTTNQDNIL